MTLNCEGYSENILDVLKLFQYIGWKIYNVEGMVEYIPSGDNGQYDWKYEKISEIDLYNIISNKIDCKEQIGINLFYKNTSVGISFLAENTTEVVLGLSINRKKSKVDIQI